MTATETDGFHGNGATAPTAPASIPDKNVAVQAVTKTINKRMRRKQSKWTLIITFLSFVLIIILITIAYLVTKGLFQTTADRDESKVFMSFCSFFSALSDQKIVGHIFVGLNYSSDKIFVTSNKFRHFCPTKNFVQISILLHITYICLLYTSPSPRDS